MIPDQGTKILHAAQHSRKKGILIIKEKTDKSDYTRIKNLCSLKEVLKGKSKPHVRGDICSEYKYSDLYPKYTTPAKQEKDRESNR